MKAATEELLMILLWTAETLIRPSWRNFDSSFESWAWRNGLGQRLAYLEREKYIEKRRRQDGTGWLYRLTAPGRNIALGGRDPEASWNRAWDGRWRIIVFDLPEYEKALRFRVWRWLRRNAFGYLQNSLWIAPDLSPDLLKSSPAASPNVETWVVFEAVAAGGLRNDAIVAGAWDFNEINARYQKYLSHLDRRPTGKSVRSERRRRLLQWIKEDQRLWSDAFSRDPLLPTVLLPRRYIGRKCWIRRAKEWGRIRELLQDEGFAT